jgi:hypothetical protein
VTIDQIDRCGCHRGCTTLPHDCDVPCRWPACLDDDEQDRLAREVLDDNG